MATSMNSFPVRVDASLAEIVREQAKRRNMSVNKLWINAMEQFLKSEKDREWTEGFEAMAQDPESCGVDYAFDAQAEVVLGSDQS